MVFKKGQIAWNKGLTKEDPRVEKYTKPKRGRKQSPENVRKNSEGHKGQIPWHKNKTNVYSKDALRNISEGTKRGMTKEVCEKISQKMKGKILSEEHKRKVSAGVQGIPLEKWEKFTSREPYDQNWNNNFKERIKQRDNFTCLNCGISEEDCKKLYKHPLAIHHIDYNKKNTIEENCCALCKRCHSLTNFNRGYWKELFQEKLSKIYVNNRKGINLIIKI